MMAGRALRVGSWNIRFGRAADAVIADMGLDLLCMQECTPDALARFRTHLDWGYSAMDPQWLDGIQVGRTHGVAVLGRSHIAPTVRPPASDLLAPEKLLAVDLQTDGLDHPLTIASYHAYAGRKGTDQLDKPLLSGQVAEWLAGETGSMVLAMDANSPWVDHPDPGQVECCFAQPDSWHMERALLHPVDKCHGLQDTLRTWLDKHPAEMARIKAERPAGPLTVSHRTGRTALGPGNPRRYDHIYASPEFEVQDVRYLYDEALAAGSDHALVCATWSSARPDLIQGGTHPAIVVAGPGRRRSFAALAVPVTIEAVDVDTDHGRVPGVRRTVP
jgi:endonuclease/exonuclease/phosphatase family metal-dependent hydrolase